MKPVTPCPVKCIITLFNENVGDFEKIEVPPMESSIADFLSRKLASLTFNSMKWSCEGPSSRRLFDSWFQPFAYALRPD